ncbi:MAG: septal ring lytic transglycosylase RlpA family protein, partial [bacterium]|nr:septal ring lytic transglycosylase RlpA family protein [bacterium]
GTLAAILTLLLTASTLGLGSTPAHAQGGLFPLPTEAGSVWRIVAGYNTLTHSVADRNDPHAIDIVRVDADTTGSVVLAPIAGTISYIDYSDCLTIDNGAGLALLLCHIFPDRNLTRYQSVRVGDYLGTVAPAYHANNGGLPHIHLAVHHTTGGGRLQGSIPLIGAWAVEGIDLPWYDQFNAHAGTRFTSSNGTGATPTPDSQPDSGSGDPQDGASSYESGALLQLQPGWNMVGWTGRTPAAEIAAALGDSLGAIFAFAVAQEYRRFSPSVPAHANDLAEVVPGAGLLVLIEGLGAVLPLPPNGRPLAQPLHRGFNLVAWTGGPATIEQATSSLGDALKAAFWWDPVAQEYRTYRPELPMFSDLKEVASGQALWLQLDAAATWNPGEAAPADGDLLRVVVSDCLNLRPAPTTIGTTPITCLPPGTLMRSLGETEVDETGREWVRVTADGRAGWVARDFTTPFQRPGTDAPAGNSGADPNGPPADAVAGDATFYHHSLAGNPMYCGGIYDPDNATIAASTTYDCGTRLRVWRGIHYVDVTVQDTGRFPVNDIDLSPAAFNLIGLPAEGRIRVHIEVLSQPGQ